MQQSAIEGKVVLITGGTGSLGKTLVRLLLEEYDPEKVIVFSRDECKQWEMRRSDPIFDHPKIRYFLGDVRDKDRLMGAFRDVDSVVHAAALKQVPAAEYNPEEFIKTNVHGAMNVVDAAVERGVENVVAISTDKAVNPVNLYGATKLCSDKLFIAANVYAGKRQKPRFSVVRYGNVLGSRGSIIPLWQQMVVDGAETIPITDPRMTRFWITVEQAAQFVVDSISHMHGGEIFVPKIPSMKLTDLAAAIAPDTPVATCGIREGEKLHEVLIGQEDARNSFEFKNHFIIAPHVLDAAAAVNTGVSMAGEKGTRLPDDFVYSSDKNNSWLSAKDLKM